MQIAHNIYLSRSDRDWIVTFDDGHARRELGHFPTRSDAVAKFGDGYQQMPIRLSIGGKDVSEIREPPQAEQNRNVGQETPDESSEDRYSYLLARLSERDRQIVSYRRGLNGQRKHTLAETAAKFGLTHGRISQIDAKIPQKLQRSMPKLDETSSEPSKRTIQPAGSRYSRLLRTLSERDRKIIIYRHGLEGEREHTAAETAARFGLSPQRIYRIEKRLSQKLLQFSDTKDETILKRSNGPFGLIGRPYSRLLTKLSERDQQIIIYRHGLREQHEHTLAETAARFGLSPQRIYLIDRQFVRNVQSSAYQKSKTSLEPSKGTPKPLGSPYSRFLTKLSERDRQIMVYRHGLEGEREHTAAETAAKFGLGRSNTHQIDTKINQKILRWVHEEVDLESEPSTGTYGVPDGILPKILRVLSERERQVLIYQCGLHRRREHTPAETAIKFGLAPATLYHVNERINWRILHWACQGSPVNRETPDAGRVVAGSRTSLASYEIRPQSGTNAPDNESRATVDATLIDDHAKGAIDSSTTQDSDAKFLEFIGERLLEVPELRALRADQPQSAGERGVAVETILASRIAAVRGTHAIATLLEWLARRLWESPVRSELLRVGRRTGAGSAFKRASKPDENAATSLGPFATAAQLLLDAATFPASPFYCVWQQLTGLHAEESDQAAMSILLQHIVILNEQSHSATAVRLQGLGFADLLARDVLDAVDEVLESGASAMYEK